MIPGEQTEVQWAYECRVVGGRGANADGRWMVVVLAGQVTDRRFHSVKKDKKAEARSRHRHECGGRAMVSSLARQDGEAWQSRLQQGKARRGWLRAATTCMHAGRY